MCQISPRTVAHKQVCPNTTNTLFAQQATFKDLTFLFIAPHIMTPAGMPTHANPLPLVYQDPTSPSIIISMFRHRRLMTTTSTSSLLTLLKLLLPPPNLRTPPH